MSPIEIYNGNTEAVEIEVTSESDTKVVSLNPQDKLMINSLEKAEVRNGSMIDHIFGLALGGTINGIWTGLTEMIFAGTVNGMRYQGFGESEIYLRNTREKQVC